MRDVAVLVTSRDIEGASSVYEIELRHIDKLRRAGVPLKGVNVFSGVVTGRLTYEDKPDGSRLYYWVLDPLKIRVKPQTRWAKVRSWFRPEYQIHRFEDISSVWFQVSAWSWYWPFWTWFTCMTAPDYVEPIRYRTLEEARAALMFRAAGLERTTARNVIEHYSPS